MSLTASTTIHLDASPAAVWHALTDPESIKKYLFGTETISDWKVGSPIEFKGAWDGHAYHDKGIILELEPERRLVYTYFSSMSGKEDLPENYAHITYALVPENGGTRLTISQDGIADEEGREKAAKDWGYVLDGLKQVAEESR